MLGCGHGLEGREPWRSGVASSDVTLTLDLVARVVYIILLLDDYVQKRNPAPRARFRFQIWALFGPNPLPIAKVVDDDHASLEYESTDLIT